MSFLRDHFANGKIHKFEDCDLFRGRADLRQRSLIATKKWGAKHSPSSDAEPNENATNRKSFPMSLSVAN